jgi:hypothetical protein
MVDPNTIVQGTIVIIKCELVLGKFTARAKVTSPHDQEGVPGIRHPTFKLLENVKHYKAGKEFWGTFEDILEVVECPQL